MHLRITIAIVGVASILFAAITALVYWLSLQPTPVAAKSQSGFEIVQEPPWTKTLTIKGRNVKQVTVNFSIIQNGRMVENLGPNYKIKIYEDGNLVDIQNVPKLKRREKLSVVFAVSTSGAMKLAQWKQLKKACQAFLAKTPEKARAGLILFDQKVHTFVPISNDKDAILKQLDAVTPKGGRNYLDACMKAIDILNDAKEFERSKAIVLLTDGVNLNSETTTNDLIRRAADCGVDIYSVGMHEGVDEIDLMKLAKATKGEYHPAWHGYSLTSVLQKVLEHTQRKQFSVTFESKFQHSSGLAHRYTLELFRADRQGVMQIMLKRIDILHSVEIDRFHKLSYQPEA